MFVINEDNSIYATRGDIVFFSVCAEDRETKVKYTFKPGDVLRIKVYGKKNAEDVVLQKDFPVTENTEMAEIFLSEEDTKIGEVISKPKDYWYEVELNPLTNPQTIIGYDEDGAKVFKLFPEGDDIPEYVPDPEDFAVMDDELDMTSTRPVQNQAVARAVAQLAGTIQDNKKKLDARDETLHARMNDIAESVAMEQQRLDIIISGSTIEDGAEVADIRVGADGLTYDSAGTAVREQFKGAKYDCEDAANGYTTFAPSLFERGGMVFEAGQNIPTGYAYRIRSKAVALAEKDITISTITDGFVVRIFRYTDESGAELVSGVWEYTSELAPVTIPAGTYFRLAILRTVEDTNEMANIKEFSMVAKMNGEIKTELDEMRSLVSSVGSKSIKFGVYNIGHFAQGQDMSSTTPANRLYEAYRAVGCLDADILGVVEDLTYTGGETSKTYKYVDTDKTVTSEAFYNKLFSHMAMGVTNGTNVNSVYSQYPLSEPSIVMFNNAAQNRYFNHVKCTLEGIDFNVIVTHLDWDTTEHRYSQVEQIIKYVNDNELEKVIICGDFNSSEGDDTFKMFDVAGFNLANQGIFGQYTTFAYNGLTASYDNIITTSDLKITNVRVHDDIKFSDHYPITATIRVL